MIIIGTRIATLIEQLGISKTKFAASLNVSPAFITQICTGQRTPSERTIADICRIYNVNEEWLHDGTGSMFITRTANEELAAMCEELLSDPDGSFRRRFVQAFLSFPPDKLDVLREFLEKLAQE